MNSLAQRIKDARQQAALTQTELAALTGCSQPFLCQLENGIRRPSLRTLQAIADAVGSHTSTLLEGNTDREA